MHNFAVFCSVVPAIDTINPMDLCSDSCLKGKHAAIRFVLIAIFATHCEPEFHFYLSHCYSIAWDRL